MSAVPFMPWYISDYLGKTQHLSTEQHGAYMLLLGAMWLSGGTLPDDPLQLARITRMTPAKWQKVGGPVLAFFATVDGRLTAPDIECWERRRIKEEGRQPIPAYVRRLVTRRDGLECRYCGAADASFEIDHVLPVSRGGTNDPDNLAVACFPCNRAKGAKLVEEWLQ